MFLKIDHIGIVTEDMEGVVKLFEEFLEVKAVKKERGDTSFGRAIFLHLENVKIEIMQPHAPDHFYTKMLKERGTCLSHIAFSTPDTNASGKGLADKGARFIPGHGPGTRSGRGYNVAFLEPRGMKDLLIQLISEKLMVP
jgi:4-hydroxyphenylpyruvate dioxygenase-like putative hemolysin